MKKSYSAIAIAISSALPLLFHSQFSFAQTNETLTENELADIEVITVNGDFRATNIQKMASAVSLLTQEEISTRQAQNLEEVLAIAPNVNFSSGSQRARYFQIRGIGERSQFKEPINPSVGVMIDGVDFTGIGSVSSMFDVAQTEIFRGPQGTRFGANALAGMVNITTNAPTDSFEGKFKHLTGNYNSEGYGLVLSGPASDRTNYRVAVEKYTSDGFIDNVHLNAKDTNNRDELSVRAKFAIQATNDLSIYITAMHFDFDNGYDAFSLDNTRETYSDQPGFDTQKTDAIAVSYKYQGLDLADIEFTTSSAKSDIGYGYDEDWAYGQYEWMDDEPEYTPDPCVTPGTCLAEFDGYSSTDHYFRDKESKSFELRASSKDGQEILGGSTAWVTGIYYKSDESNLERIYTWEDDFTSVFETYTLAVYSEFVSQITPKLTLTSGIRIENRDSNYSNSSDLKTSPSETMFGGKLVLGYQLDDSMLVYGSINKGYKAGGINTDGSLTDEQREFDSESVINYELGLKATLLDGNAYLRAATFYMDRQDMQVKISYAQSKKSTEAVEFIEYLDNSTEGFNAGAEVEFGISLNEYVELYSSLGLLKSEYDNLTYQTEDGEVSLSGREQAHAPAYQFSLGSNINITDQLLFNVSVEGKDEFYFSDSHNIKSGSYQLVNASLTYSEDDWSVSLWGRNITDQEYQTRGFNFPNDPRDGYTNDVYYQLGEPAVFGLTANIDF